MCAENFSQVQNSIASYCCQCQRVSERHNLQQTMRQSTNIKKPRSTGMLDLRHSATKSALGVFTMTYIKQQNSNSFLPYLMVQ